MNEDLHAIARHFVGGQHADRISALGCGLINDTYLVSTQSDKFVLQRINTQVFPEPQRVIENLLQINRHLQKDSKKPPLIIPLLQPTLSGEHYYSDNKGHFWRLLEWIEHSESRERISRLEEAQQVGLALGRFHRMLASVESSSLHDTLPGFHIAPTYLKQYQEIVINSPVQNNNPDFVFCRDFITRYHERAQVLEQARQQGILHDRVIHGDPKLNNFLFLQNSDIIISLIDLDTVKPGLVHYDIADCLRSCCQKSDNSFDLATCRAILSHYLQEAGHFFTPADYDYLYPAIELLPFELGLRFFTDFLAGNCYFKVTEPDQNLLRAHNQFRLCEAIRKHQPAIESMLDQLRSC
jgi:Ser/Thr protein kinase RdoA (MazF antagonist)